MTPAATTIAPTNVASRTMGSQRRPPGPLRPAASTADGAETGSVAIAGRSRSAPAGVTGSTDAGDGAGRATSSGGGEGRNGEGRDGAGGRGSGR